jgi:hypothetical protein
VPDTLTTTATPIEATDQSAAEFPRLSEAHGKYQLVRCIRRFSPKCTAQRDAAGRAHLERLQLRKVDRDAAAS